MPASQQRRASRCPPGCHTIYDAAFSTHANELGLALPHVIEACLGHISGFRAGVAGTYNLARYRSETRIAWQRWAECLLSWIEGRECNVVTLQRG